MKTTIEKLDHTIGLLSETIELCSTSKNKREIVAALANSNQSLSSTLHHLRENEKRKFVAVRKALMSVSNVIGGMHDGIVDSTMTFSEVRAANRSLQIKFFPMVRDGLLEEAAASAESDVEPVVKSSVPAGVRTKIKITIANLPEMQEAIDVVSTSNTAGFDVSANSNDTILEKLGNEARAALPIRIPGEFQIVRVPIVPIFPNPALTRPEILKRLGLKFVTVEGIIILLDQILLNVSKRRAEGSNRTPLALAHSVVELLNERSTSKYEIVADTPNANPRNTDLLMFWILPRQRMSGLMKILGASSTPAIVKWGLPLPSSGADRDLARIARIEKQHEEAEKARQEKAEEAAALLEKKEAARRAAKEKRIAEQRSIALEKKKPITVKPKAKPVVAAPSRKEKVASPEKIQQLVKLNTALRGRR